MPPASMVVMGIIQSRYCIKFALAFGLVFVLAKRDVCYTPAVFVFLLFSFAAISVFAILSLMRDPDE